MKSLLSSFFIVLMLSINVSAQQLTGISSNLSSNPNLRQPLMGNGSTPYGVLFDTNAHNVQIIGNSDFSLLTNSFSYSDSYSISAGDLAGNQMYVVNYSNSSHSLYQVNFNTNSLSFITNIYGVVLAGKITGMTYHAPTEKMYVCSSNLQRSELYTINLTTGHLTHIGQIHNFPGVYGIAINNAGQLFGHETFFDNLIEINPTTGAGTIIGPLGVNAILHQGMDFDDASGKLIWAANTVDGATIREINITNASSTVIRSIGGGSIYGALAIGSGIPTVPIIPVPVNLYVIIALFVLLGGLVTIRFFRR